MYDFFKQIAQKNYCKSNGVCSVHPSINSLLELLLNEAREIANYIVKLKEFKITLTECTGFLVEILSIHLINTSFSEEDYLKIINKLHQYKLDIKEKYVEFCKSNKLPCEIINTDFNLNNLTTISELIKFSEENITNRQKGCDKNKFRLFELITIFVRLCAINIVKIKKIEPEFNNYDFEIVRFFALTNGYTIRNEKIIRRIKEFPNIAFKIRKKLSNLLQTRYGTIEDANIDIYSKKGHCILVSGEDFDELEDVLKSLENFKTSDKINVYTHGELILAHFYPFFKHNKFLAGHWGKNDTEYDFSTFPGAIFMTQNFNQKIDNLYKGELFSSKLISFKKVCAIKNNDFTPVINSALKLEGFIQSGKEEIYKPNNAIKKIEELLENFDGNELIIIAGSKNPNFEETHKGKTVINIPFPYDIEILTDIIKKCTQNSIKLTLFFTQCNKASLESLLILINSNIEIALADCSYALINPHVTEALKNDFNIKII